MFAQDCLTLVERTSCNVPLPRSRYQLVRSHTDRTKLFEIRVSTFILTVDPCVVAQQTALPSAL